MSGIWLSRDNEYLNKINKIILFTIVPWWCKETVYATPLSCGVGRLCVKMMGLDFTESELVMGDEVGYLQYKRNKS